MVKCKYCGEETSKKDAICNSCTAKLNAKRYIKEILRHYNPDEVFSKRNLSIYLDKSLNLEIVLLTLNDHDLIKRRGAHAYRIATEDVINEFLWQNDLSLIKKKESKSKKSSKSLKTESVDEESVPPKKCKICGSDLPKNSKNDICRKCSKKIHAVNVLEEIIPITGVEIPFKKDDLNDIYKNNPIKAQDTIWTLQDFNLVNNVGSNTFELVSENKINQFFKENNSSNKVSDLTSKKSEHLLQKTCLKCNKTLPISEFRKISEDKYSDYCKSCDKLMKTADYVIEFIDVVGYDEFKIDDVKNIENIQGKIFNLQDNDLITFNGQTYQLISKEKIDSFLNTNIGGDSKLNNILDAFKAHDTMIEAAKSVGVSNVDVTNYYIEGKNGNSKYVEFFNEINAIKKEKSEKIPCPKCKTALGYDNGKCKVCGHVNINILNLNDKFDFVLSFIEKNNGVKAAKKLDIPYDNIKLWYDLGKSGISPYTKFFDGIKKIKKESKSNTLKKDKISEITQRLNENLHEIQRNELILDKNILKLKTIDLSNEVIKSQHDELYDEIQIMKNDLIFKKNEIKSIKEDLPKYSLEELNNVKSFKIKNTRTISLKVTNLLKRYDKYCEEITIKKQESAIEKHILKLENLKQKIKSEIETTEQNILKMNNTKFDSSFNSKKNRLIYSLNSYKSDLSQYNSYIEQKLNELKINKNPNLNIKSFNFIDYSTKVDDLIDKSGNEISKHQISQREEKFEYDAKLAKVNDSLNKTNNYIKKLDKTNFVDSYESDKSNLLEKLNNYKSDLSKYKSKLLNFKDNIFASFPDNFNFIDYSDEVDELISKNDKQIAIVNEKIILQINNKINEVNEQINEVDNYIEQLDEITFDSYESDKSNLIMKLNNYKSDLTRYKTKLSFKLKKNDFVSYNIEEFNFVDYSSKVDDLISRNDKQLSIINENIINNKFDEVNGAIDEVDYYIKRLDETSFVDSYEQDKSNLLEKLNNYKSDLSRYKSRLSLKFKKNYFDAFDVEEFDFVDYSFEVDDLISKNDKEIFRENAVLQINNKLDEISKSIDEVDYYIKRLDETNFVDSYEQDKSDLIIKLKDYKSKLTRYKNRLSLKLKYKNFDGLNDMAFDFVDYSVEVDDLISKNDKEIFRENAVLQIDNKLDEISKSIDDTDNHIKKLYKTSFNDCYKSDKSYLIIKLNNYVADLIKYKSKLLKLKYGNFDSFNGEEFDLVDYSAEVDELITKNKNLSDEKTKNNGHIFNFKKSNQESSSKDTNIVNKILNRFKKNSSKEKTEINIENHTTKSLDKESQRKLFLKYYKKTMDFKEASKLADVPIFRINRWYKSGKDGVEDCVDFYNEINEIKNSGGDINE